MNNLASTVLGYFFVEIEQILRKLHYLEKHWKRVLILSII